MKKIILTAGALFALASPAFAVPALPAPQQDTLVQNARSDCRWVDNKWTYRKGDKTLVCRPDRPSGRGWNWHREGGREGWYHGTRKAWHFNNW